MNNKAIENYKKNKHCQKVTFLPDFVLKIKGKLDVSKRESTAHVFINGLYDKCVAIESLEVSKAENLLQDYRDEGKQLLYKVGQYTRSLHRISKEGTSVRQNAHKEFKEDVNRLIKIYDIIRDVNTALERRISKTRQNCSHKIGAYTQGIKLVMPDFSLITYHYEKSIEEYLSKHKDTDDAIARIAKSITDEEYIALDVKSIH